MDVTALRFPFDGHFRNDGNPHTGADHALSRLLNWPLSKMTWDEARASQAANGRVSEAMAVTQQQERFGAEVSQ